VHGRPREIWELADRGPLTIFERNREAESPGPGRARCTTDTNGHSATVHGAIASGSRAARQVLDERRK